MKKISFLIITGAVVMLAACNNAPKGEEAKVAETQEVAAGTGSDYKVAADGSSLAWIGAGPTKQHNGTLQITEGTLKVENNVLTAGSFTVDVNSLTDLDLTGEFKGKLEGHLKSADFFDVEKHPTAKFEITKVEALTDTTGTHSISGNLTLKDSTKNITFPAKVTISETEVNATANFNIDRTLWGVNYGNDKSLKDKFIKPEVNISVVLKATK
jgi:polyisoprenoid-binding protein YceI